MIEDDPSVGAAIRLTLDREGGDTVRASSADAGIEVFDSSSVDLVIVDIFMPGMSGLNAITGFRQRAPKVSIFAMSGFRFRDSMDPGLEFLGMAAVAGATVCLRKPFTSRQLMAAIHTNLEPERSQRSNRDLAQGLLL